MANNHTAGAAARTFAPSELCQRMLAKTSKGTCGPCILYLEDGTIFYGRACGAEGTATGEVCFNTSLEGYFEVMTDPSYAGQIVTMTYPQIGNYGIDETDVQSAFPGDTARPASATAKIFSRTKKIGAGLLGSSSLASSWRSTSTRTMTPPVSFKFTSALASRD